MFTKKEFPDVKTAVKRVKFEKFAVGDASGRGVLCGTGGGNCDCSGGKIAPCVGLTDYLLPSGGNPSIPNPHDPPAVFALLPGTDENGERTERVAFVSKRGLAYLYNDTRQEFCSLTGIQSFRPYTPGDRTRRASSTRDCFSPKSRLPCDIRLPSTPRCSRTARTKAGISGSPRRAERSWDWRNGRSRFISFGKGESKS